MSSAFDDFASVLNECRTHKSHTRPVVIATCLVALALFILLVGRSPLVALVAASAVGVSGFWAYRTAKGIDTERRITRVTYTPQPTAANSRISLYETAGTLAKAGSVWASDSSADRGLDAQTPRPLPVARLRVVLGIPQEMFSNASGWRLEGTDECLYFLPDRLLLFRRGTYIDIRYDALTVDQAAVRYQGETIPADAREVHRTWLHARQDGGPNQRYKHNPQIIIADMGVVRLTGPGGFARQFVFSDPDLAVFLADVLRNASREVSRGQAPTPSVTAPPALSSALQPQGAWKYTLLAMGGLVVLSTLVGLAAGGRRTPAAAPPPPPPPPVQATVAVTATLGPATEEADIWTSTATARATLAAPRDGETPTSPVPLASPANNTPTVTAVREPPTATPKPTATPGPNVSASANLRTGPGTNYPLAGGLTQGAKLQIVARNPRGDWYQLADSRWIWARLVANPPADVAQAANIPPPPAPTPTPAPVIRAAPTVPPLQFSPAPVACCKVCRTGYACGNSCISRSKQCHQPPGCACNG
jgi:hypothetical protein